RNDSRCGQGRGIVGALRMMPTSSLDLSDLPVVDGHCHPFLSDAWGPTPEHVLSLFSEGRPGTMAGHVPHTGYFRRAFREFARRLQTDTTVEAVLEARRRLGAE